MRSTKYHFVSTFNKRMWDAYVKTNVESWLRNMPEDVTFTLWIEGEFPKDLPEDSRVTYKMLSTNETYLSFLYKHGHHRPPQTAPGHEFRFQYIKFWHKVAAWTETYFEKAYMHGDYLVWIDADVLSFRQVFINYFLRMHVDADIAWLDRDNPWYAIESGMVFAKIGPGVEAFFTELVNVYLSGMLFDFQEWHDGFILKALSKFYRNRLNIISLSPNPKERDVFDLSILAEYFKHDKGTRKPHVA